jgi:hypothetical protein
MNCMKVMALVALFMKIADSLLIMILNYLARHSVLLVDICDIHVDNIFLHALLSVYFYLSYHRIGVPSNRQVLTILLNYV